LVFFFRSRFLIPSFFLYLVWVHGFGVSLYNNVAYAYLFFRSWLIDYFFFGLGGGRGEKKGRDSTRGTTRFLPPLRRVFFFFFDEHPSAFVSCSTFCSALLLSPPFRCSGVRKARTEQEEGGVPRRVVFEAAEVSLPPSFTVPNLQARRVLEG